MHRHAHEINISENSISALLSTAKQNTKLILVDLAVCAVSSRVEFFAQVALCISAINAVRRLSSIGPKFDCVSYRNLNKAQSI